MGYDTYAAYDAMGVKLVVPGVITEQTKKRKKFPNHDLRFTRAEIESFLSSHLAISDDVKRQRDIEFRNLTHDLRPLSSEIYHEALELRRLIADGQFERCPDLIEDILASQQMISMRLDIVDYEAGQITGRAHEDIPAFRRVDKVLRSFRNRMRHKRMRYTIEGRTFAMVNGPSIFEMVPFVIVENAVKYAPIGSELLVRFEEKADELLIRFESFGPEITDGERERIFEQHYRGDAAASQPGSGIGLYAARSLLASQFGGRISTNPVGKRIWQDGETYHLNRFTVILPISGYEQQREFF